SGSAKSIVVEEILETVEKTADVVAVLAEVHPGDGDRAFAANEEFFVIDLDEELGAPGHDDAVEFIGHRSADAITAILDGTPAEVVEGVQRGARQHFSRGAAKADGFFGVSGETEGHDSTCVD